jgi:tetratricopeptide (TPR) repeat protein
VVLVATAGALVLPWLAYRYESAAAGVWRDRPSVAYDRLDFAADLNPLSAEPLVLEGSIAIRRGDMSRARESLRDAVAREPGTWYAWLQLGLLDAWRKRLDLASAEIQRARELNPKDPAVALASRLVRRRIAIDPQAVNALYLAQQHRRFGP